MEYIIISLSTISVFTYIVYIVANKILAIKMHIKFPILCACCALLISLILPRIFVGVAGLTGTLGIVTLFAIISSYCIAYYYDNTMEKVALKSSALATHDLEVVELPQEEEFLDPIPTQNEILPSNDLENKVEITEDIQIITEPLAKEYFYPIKYVEKNKPCIALVVLENNSIMIIEPHNSEILLDNAIEIEEGATDFIFKLNFKNKVTMLGTPFLLEAIHRHLDAPISNPLMIISEEETPDQNVTAAKCESVSPEELQQIITSQDTLVEKTIDLEIVVEDSHPSSDELDVLMDFAFLQKEQRNFIQAIKVFRRALQLYPDSEAGPFLVMEIGTILKNIGSYNEALDVFTEGQLLPGVISNNMLEQEFFNNIAYLHIVKNVLTQNSLEFMPFNNIPEKLFKEIDSEFCKWRNQS